MTTLLNGLNQAKEYLIDRRPDNSDPKSPSEQFANRVRTLRARLNLSQQAFAERYGLPIGTVRNWEQARTSKPDATGDLVLRLIENDPEGVAAQVGNMKTKDEIKQKHEELDLHENKREIEDA